MRGRVVARERGAPRPDQSPSPTSATHVTTRGLILAVIVQDTARTTRAAPSEALRDHVVPLAVASPSLRRTFIPGICPGVLGTLSFGVGIARRCPRATGAGAPPPVISMRATGAVTGSRRDAGSPVRAGMAGSGASRPVRRGSASSTGCVALSAAGHIAPLGAWSIPLSAALRPLPAGVLSPFSVSRSLPRSPGSPVLGVVPLASCFIMPLPS